MHRHFRRPRRLIVCPPLVREHLESTPFARDCHDAHLNIRGGALPTTFKLATARSARPPRPGAARPSPFRARGSDRRTARVPALLGRRGREGDESGLQGGSDSALHAAPAPPPASHALASRQRPDEGVGRPPRPRRRRADAEPLFARQDPGELSQASLEALLVWSPSGLDKS